MIVIDENVKEMNERFGMKVDIEEIAKEKGIDASTMLTILNGLLPDELKYEIVGEIDEFLNL
ncbi:MAG: hypothetical protein MJZ34_11365 [Paludibacteraceae bacterium]|nr:hypothetical protein [Paludibacteraceae bacterium]